MAYDEGLAQRIREHLADQPNVTEKKMFGGIGFMLNGHMVVGVSGNDLMARVGVLNHVASLALPGAREVDMTGRPMRGMLFVDVAGLTEQDVAAWIDRCVAHAKTLPPK